MVLHFIYSVVYSTVVRIIKIPNSDTFPPQVLVYSRSGAQAARFEVRPKERRNAPSIRSMCA